MADDKYLQLAVEISRIRTVEAARQLEEKGKRLLTDNEISIIYDHIYSAIVDFCKAITK